MFSTPAARRASAPQFVAVTLLASSITALVILRQTGTMPGWLVPFFAPSAIGFMLVGGAHGGGPNWLLVTAGALANGIAWGLLIALLTGVYRAVARPR